MIEEQNVNKARPPVPKAFAGIYYSVLAVVAALLLIFSFVTYFYAPASRSASFDTAAAHEKYAVRLAAGERNTFTEGTGTTADRAVRTIDGWLADIAGLTKVSASKADQTATKTSARQKITADMANNGGATYTVQDFSQYDIDYTLDIDTVGDMSREDAKEDLVYAARQVKNFIVAIPGTAAENKSAVLFMTHYDSNAGSVGASSAASVAAMIGTIDYLINGYEGTFANDLVFVITDGRYEDSVGAYAFKNQFIGFDNVYGRVKAAFNFDALTAGGALTAVETSDADSGIVSGYLASAASVRTDSSVAALMDGRVASDFDIFRDKENDGFAVPCMNFMTTAGPRDAGSDADNLDNVGADITAQYASAMESLAVYFGNADLGSLATPADAATYTYLGMGAGTPGFVVYILAVLLLLLLAGNIVIAVRKKTFGVRNAFKGLGGVAIALAVSLAAFFIAYFIIGLLSVAFGAITMEWLVTAHMLDAAVLVPAIFFAAAVSCGVYPAVKRAFKIKASDCVRGGALLQMLVAVCFGFVFPPAALPFLIIGLANGAVMLLLSLLKKVFRDKFGFGIDRLFLYTLPAMFGVPFLVQATLTICNLFPVVTLPFLLLAFSLLFAALTPYFDYLQPVLTDAFEKLPKHTVPVVETVVEEREDPAKKGKFETVTETKVVNHKVAWRYHNWFGVTFVCVLTAVALLISTPVGAAVGSSLDRNVSANYDYTYTNAAEALYDNAVVCYVDGSISSVSRYSWLVKDEAVYQTLRYLDGYDYWEWTWDDNFGAYKKTVTDVSMPTTSELFKKESVDGGYEITVKPTYKAASQVKMKLSGINAGDKVVVTKKDGSEAEFTLTFESPADYVDFVLPFGYGECTVKVETSATSMLVTGYEYYDARTDIPGMFGNAYVEYYDMADYFSGQGKTLKAAFLLYGSA